MDPRVQALYYQFAQLATDEQRQFINLLVGPLASRKTVYLVQTSLQAQNLAPFNLLEYLPVEVTLKILDYLPLTDLASLAQTCRLMNSTVQDPGIWRKCCFRILHKQPPMGSDYRQIFKQEYGLHRNWLRGTPRVVTTEQKGVPIRGVALEKESMLITFDRGIIEEVDARSGSPIRQVAATSSISQMRVDFQRREIVVGCFTKTTKVINLDTGREMRSFTGHFGPVLCVALSQKQMASGSTDHLILTYSRTPGASTEGLSSHQSAITNLLFLDDTQLLSAEEEGIIVKWNLETALPEKTIALAGIIKDMILSPHGKVLIATTESIHMLDLDLHQCATWDLPASSLAISHGLIIAAGEHLHTISEETLELQKCLCCRGADPAKFNRKRYSLLAASERYLAAVEYDSVTVFDFSPL